MVEGIPPSDGTSHVVPSEDNAGTPVKEQKADVEQNIKGIVADKIKSAPPSPTPRRTLSASVVGAGPKVHIAIGELTPGTPDKEAVILHRKGEAQTEHSISEEKQGGLYDKIAEYLTAKGDKFDPETVRKAISTGLSRLHSAQQKDNVQGMSLKVGESAHVIVHLGKKDDLKFSPFSGVSHPQKGEHEAFIAKGSFGIVQQSGRKALKTIIENKPGAKADVQNAVKMLHHLHSISPEGQMPGIEAAPKTVLVATGRIDKNGEPEFVEGALSHRYFGEASELTGIDVDRLVFRREFEKLFHALSFMHEQGIPHRDIKAQNIWVELTKDGKTVLDRWDREAEVSFYLGDFGDVKPPSEWGQETRVIGTSEFMPGPEFASYVDAVTEENWEAAKEIRCQMDVFALGAALFEIIVGVPVYENIYHPHPDDERFLDTSVLTEYAEEAFEEFGNVLGDNFTQFLLATLDPDPARRPTAAQCEAVLKEMP